MCSFTISISISAATSRASHAHLSWMTKGHSTNAKVCLRKMHSCQSSFETTLISRHQTSSRFLLLPWQLYEQNTVRFSHPHKRFIFIIQMNIQINSVNLLKNTFADSFAQLCQKSFWSISLFIFNELFQIFKFIHTSLYSIVSVRIVYFSKLII